MLEDYYPLLGFHQGYMPVFSKASGLSLQCLFTFHLKKIYPEKAKFQNLSKTDKLVLLQEGVELLRPLISLENLAGITEYNEAASADYESPGENQKKWEEFSLYIKNNYHSPEGLIMPELVFGLLEWNMTGAALYEAYLILLNYIIPDSYSDFLKNLLKDDDKLIRTYLTDREQIKKEIEILREPEREKKLYGELIKQ